MSESMPTVFWNTDDECWSVEHGDIRVNFLYDPEKQVTVSGHLLTMEIFQDSITEERGILFTSRMPQTRY